MDSLHLGPIMAIMAPAAWLSIGILKLLPILLGGRALSRFSFLVSNSSLGREHSQNAYVVYNQSLHSSVLAAKELVRLFYGKAHKKSYFLGCSLGGRQGIKAAEMFPNEFDGILSGSPALDYNNLVSWRASFFPITGSVNLSDFITPAAWKTLIHKEILNQCDGLDGVIDGVIEDPNLCYFLPEILSCAFAVSRDCLTDVQIKILRKVFSPLYGEDGKIIYPAMQPGSEILAVEKLYAGKPFSYSEVMNILSLNPFVADI